MKLSILLCFSLLLISSVHAKEAVNKEVVVPENPMPEIKGKDKLSFSVVAQSAATNQCDHLDHKHRVDCQKIQDYYLHKAASEGYCKKLDKDLVSKCGEIIQTAKKLVADSSVSAQDSKVNERITKLFLERCSQEKGQSAKSCEVDLAKNLDAIEYQEGCYRCMNKKFLQQCLRLDLYKIDHYLKRKLQTSAFIGECEKLEDDKHKTACHYFRETMLEVEAQGKTCSNFITPNMVTACEDQSKSPHVNDSKTDGKSRENRKDEAIRVLTHEVSKQ